MGLMSKIAGLLLGSGRNVVVETAGAFRPNAEADAARSADIMAQGMAQYAAEFAPRQKGRFDQFMDGVNRIPRPLMVFAVLGLISMAMLDPIWFASRMQGLQLVPDPLWALVAGIAGFYFHGRHQFKTQEFQRSLEATAQRVPKVIENMQSIQSIGVDVAAGGDLVVSDNPALTDWKSEGKG